MADEKAPAVTIDRIVAGYLLLRDKRSALKKKYTVMDDALKEKMEKIEVALLGIMQKTGAKQLGSDLGTAYQQTVLKSNCSDWPTFWSFVSQNQRFDMLEKRVSTKTVQEYHDETGELPPGIDVHPEIKVVIRKK